MSKRPPLVIYSPECFPRKMQFIGMTRHDWSRYMRWLKISPKYNKHQCWNKYLEFPSIFLEPSKYIDGRSKRANRQVKVKITIEEVD